LVGWSQDTSHEPRFSRAAMLSCSIGAAALAIAVTMWSGAVRLHAQDDLLTRSKAMYAGLRSCPDTGPRHLSPRERPVRSTLRRRHHIRYFGLPNGTG